MSLLRKIRRWESRWYGAMVGLAERVVRTFIKAAKRFLSSFQTPYSIVIVTDTIEKPRGFRISRGVLTLILAVPLFLLFYTLWLSNGTAKSTAMLRTASDTSKSACDKLDAVRNAVEDLQASIPEFQTALKRSTDLLRRIGGASVMLPPEQESSRGPGDNASERRLKEADTIAGLQRTLEEATTLLQAGGSAYETRRLAMENLPSQWPISGGLGYITTYFGATTNPFTGLPYSHKGLDISNGRQGDPVIATAGGTVVTAGYDQSYGNMVVMRHANGYYTRFGHMQSLSVRKGQIVKQGTMLGKVGNTGLSTGAHVHYEVILGGQLVDPLAYIEMPPNDIGKVRLQ